MKRFCALLLTATAVSLSQLACSSGNQANANAPISNSSANTSGPAISPNAPGTANTGGPSAAVPSANTNANAGANETFPELVMLYSQLFTARMKGDKAKAEGLLADDYKEMTGDGKTLTKAQVVAAAGAPKKYESYSLDDLKSSISGDSGTVTGRVTVMYPENKQESWQFSDTFRKQGNKWQAVSSKITDLKKQ